MVGIDNLITGDLTNIEHLFKLEQFEFYHHDVSKFIHISGNLDYILHFASPASPIDKNSDSNAKSRGTWHTQLPRPRAGKKSKNIGGINQ